MFTVRTQSGALKNFESFEDARLFAIHGAVKAVLYYYGRIVAMYNPMCGFGLVV